MDDTVTPISHRDHRSEHRQAATPSIDPVGPESTRLLTLYLRDHHAASTAGRALLARIIRENVGTGFETALRPVVGQLAAEQDVIERCLTALGSAPSRLKDTVTRLAELTARVKSNGRWITYSPLSRLVELEALAAGITSKRQMWRTLAALGDERLNEVSTALTPTEFVQLERQATQQLYTVESLHEQARGLAFGA